MQKANIIVFVILLGFSASIAPADSTVTTKAGAICTKKGESRVVKSVKLVCTKSGNQLKWKVSKPKTKTPKPNPGSKQPAQPILPITFDNLDRNRTSVEAKRKVNELFLKTTPVESTAIYYVGPNVREDILIEEKRLLQIGERFFYQYFKPSKFHVLLFSEKDVDWLEANQEPKFRNRSSLKQSIQSAPTWCNWAGATRHENGEPLFYMCLQTTGRGIADKQTSIHEYFHLLQFEYNGSEKMPCWIMEGTATFFGVALGVGPADPTGVLADNFLRDLAYNYNPQGITEIKYPNSTMRDALLTENGPISIMKELEFPTANASRNCAAWGAYTAGWLATEALVAVAGVETFMDFLKLINTEVSWKIAFEKTYNMSVDTFYQKLSPYLRSKLAN